MHLQRIRPSPLPFQRVCKQALQLAGLRRMAQTLREHPLCILERLLLIQCHRVGQPELDSTRVFVQRVMVGLQVVLHQVLLPQQ